MTEYVWSVWRECRLVGYVKGYSEYSAMQKAEKEYGKLIFLERAYMGQTEIDCSESSCPS